MSYLSAEIRQQILAYIPRYPSKQAVTLPALHIVHDAMRHVSQEAIREIADMLDLKKPAMISRIGSNELSCIYNFLTKRRKGTPYPELIKHAVSVVAGVFPPTDEVLDSFSQLFLERLVDADLLGVWFNNHEDQICRRYCKNSAFTRLRSLEPYYHQEPWSRKLEGKRVLVIHPFAESITRQYKEHRRYIFNDRRVLPDFELMTMPAVQSLANAKTGFNTWLEALSHMEHKIAEYNYDIAIIGAGAYGLPLAAHVKRSGKIAIHLGGAVQILFGIKGSRWDTHEYISKLYNEHWIRPLPLETPALSSKVEDGCYW